MRRSSQRAICSRSRATTSSLPSTGLNVLVSDFVIVLPQQKTRPVAGTGKLSMSSRGTTRA